MTETWLNDSINDNELGLHKYQIYRCDRGAETSSKNRGGGVLIAVKSSLMSTAIYPILRNVEHSFVAIKSSNGNILVGAVYLPPNSPSVLYENHCDSVEYIVNRGMYSEVFIFGDYNLPGTDWSLSTETKCDLSPQAQAVQESFSLLELTQVNTVKNCNNVLLDLAFCSYLDVSSSLNLDPFLACDHFHPAIHYQIKLKTVLEYDNYKFSVYDFKNCDYENLTHHLNCINWPEILCNVDLNSAVENFYTIVYEAIDIYVPTIFVGNSNYPKWVSTELKECILFKKLYHKIFKISGLPNDYKIFSSYRRKCKVLSKMNYISYIRSLESNVNHNIKCFWNYVRHTRRQDKLPNQMFLKQQLANNNLDIANLFADYFANVYSTEEPDVVPEFNYNSIITFGKMVVTVEDLLKKLNNLDVTKSAGPDNLPPLFFKKCASSVVYPLYILFNISLSEGIVPEHFKRSFIVPIHKNEDRSNIENYRPIAIQSTIAKILEGMVVDKLNPLINLMISVEQHGFRPGSSTLTNLLVFLNFTALTLEDYKQVDTVYLDFSKAFDKVNHSVLLAKLNAFGIFGTMLSWIRSYLQNRTSVVRVNNSRSYPIRVTSGVPQGSYLGPLLFIMFMNDIGSCMNQVNHLLYADDIKLFLKIETPNDCQVLQNALNNVCNWCHINCMKINSNKSFIMSYSRNKKTIISNYFLESDTISRTNQFRDLGIIFETTLNFNAHVQSIALKAYRMLGFLHRTTKEFNDINSIKVLYISLVRSILEYCSPVWSPNYSLQKNLIERIQYKFCRMLFYKFGVDVNQTNYHDLLSVINLETLEARRRKADLIFFFKLLNNQTYCSPLLEQISFRVPAVNSRNKETFYLPKVKTNYTYFNPMNRMMRESNSLQLNIDLFNQTLVSFKRNL